MAGHVKREAELILEEEQTQAGALERDKQRPFRRLHPVVVAALRTDILIPQEWVFPTEVAAAVKRERQRRGPQDRPGRSA
jgi:hypothetical protein